MDLVAGALRAAALQGKVVNKLYVRTAAKRRVDRRRSAFYEQLWSDAAAELGGSVRPLRPPLLEIACGGVLLRVRDNVTSLDDPVTVAIADDKPLVYRLLADQGIPVPRHRLGRSDDLRGALGFLRTAPGPCVVKPARTAAGGIGVTTGVLGWAGLSVALVRAGVFCDDALVEEQVEGGVYRLLYLDGELLDAVVRRPPTVTGDGVSTVRRLVEAENRRRTDAGIEGGQSLVQLDWELRTTLRAAGLGLDAVPEAGRVVRLKGVVNDNRRDDNEAATIGPDLAALGARAAAAVGARLAGVDVITTDPSVPLAESGGVVIEVNATPGYYYHYLRRGAGTAVAATILERLVAAAR